MTPTCYRTLGRSGLVVSPLALGTMTFGAPRWGVDMPTARTLFEAYRESGGNFIDTADVYGAGMSEQMIGGFIADSQSRDELVVASKFGFNLSTSPISDSPGGRPYPHGGGAGAKHIHQALNHSLRRLRTDYIDLYWMHIWDGVTPVEEIVQTLGDLVRLGKIRYFGFSDMPAWVAMKAATISAERRVPGPIAIQVEYSLVARDVEREHFAVAREGGMGVVPWAPLAGGFLSGKYSRGCKPEAARLSGPNPMGESKFTEENWKTLDVLKSVSLEVERPSAQVALAWAMSRPEVGSTLIGATHPSQLADNLAAIQIVLTADQIARLNRVSEPAAGFSGTLTSAPIRKMLFGGHIVQGWQNSAER